LRLSRAFLPTLKEIPAEAAIASHKLMLRAGMIRQTSAGIYAWLPLGLRVLKQGRADRARGAGRRRRPGNPDADDPAADLWKQSGRYDDYGKEMLRIKDRHEREMLFGPTNEEMVTDIFRATPSPTATCRATSTTSSGSSGTRCAPASA
jgi:prolyl-tRNA synthetase